MADEALLDVNVLIALAWPQHVHHARVQRWLARRTECWYSRPVTEAAFLRLSLDRAVIGTETRPAHVLEVVQAFRQDRRHRFLEDDSSPSEARITLSRCPSGSQVTDLHLVNLSASHGLRLATLEMLEPPERSLVELIKSSTTGSRAAYRFRPGCVCPTAASCSRRVSQRDPVEVVPEVVRRVPPAV